MQKMKDELKEKGEPVKAFFLHKDSIKSPTLFITP